MVNREPVIIESTFPVPIEKVWSALTHNHELKKWYFQLEEFKPEIGFKFQFSGGPEDGPQFLHLCEITQIVQGKKIAYTWKYDSYPGDSEIIWELIETGENTKLKLTHTGLESFEENGKDFSKESFKGGWNYFVNDALKNYLSAK